MGTLLKFLLIAIAVLWLLRLLARFLFPWALKKAAEKVMGDAHQQFRGQQGGPFADQRGPYRKRDTPKPDGKIRIDYIPPQEKSNEGPKKAGEFVDFEEVK